MVSTVAAVYDHRINWQALTRKEPRDRLDAGKNRPRRQSRDQSKKGKIGHVMPNCFAVEKAAAQSMETKVFVGLGS
jgi:hypothetical protein